MIYRNLALSTRGAVALLSLARPRRHNRIDISMAQELREACALLEQDDAVRVVVLVGRGRDFCAGSVLDRRKPRGRGGIPNEFLTQHRAADAIAGIGKPTVAVLQGAVLGQGLELALACDVRLAEEGARLGLPQVSWGAIPWDGGTQRLARLVGAARALELLLSGQEIEAAEALALGLVNRVVERGQGMRSTRQLAGEIAQRAPVATRYVKEAVLQGMDSSLPQGLRLEADLNFLLHTTQDRAKGIASFLKRTNPRYTGR